MLLALFTTLSGCAPMDAEVSGQYFAWLGANSSATVDEGRIDGVLDQAATIDCVREDGEPGYIGNSDADFNCDDVAALTYFTWPQDDGYYGITGKIEPWRTEALLTSEGDFQITTHVELGQTEDFRFHFTIAPDFAPTECIEDESGAAVAQDVDGASWVEKWSEDEDGYAIYYLNAGATQINPGNQEDYWYLTSEWLSGYGAGRFGSDDLGSIPSAYSWTDPFANIAEYNSASRKYKCTEGSMLRLFYPGSYFEATSDSDGNACESSSGGSYDAIVTDINESAATWMSELNDVMGAQIDGAPAFAMKVEDNSWRESDDVAVGLDNWVEVHSSWVRVKDGSNIEVGGSAEGDFQILYQASESASYVLVTGSWKVDDIKEDKWGYNELEEDLIAASGSSYCGN